MLTDLGPGSFAHLPRLRRLVLANNRLAALGKHTFLGLGALRALDLSRNRLAYTPLALPPGVFAPLGGLKKLRLAGNSPDSQGEYPPGVFRDLTALTTLVIDTFQVCW